MDIPRRMFTSEVLELTRWTESKLRLEKKRNRFPRPIDRSREAIYDGYEVYSALNMIERQYNNSDENRLMSALEEL